MRFSNTDQTFVIVQNIINQRTKTFLKKLNEVLNPKRGRTHDDIATQ